ncbi:uncharacterized protein n4bp2l2 [Leuresthes tenuis]|uniref:uncharacterized protein n4bp2l2 n=1 Tax=Leuresthes tenuis TaxID=355514 RepID=UPI003B510B59
MSRPELSSMNSNSTKKPCVYENKEECGDDFADKSPNCVSTGRSSPDTCVRDRVLKEVGLTSTVFIGPAFPPETPKAKTDFEDSLSEFYKELEKIDAPNGADDNPGKQNVQPFIPPETSTSKKTQDRPKEKIITRNSVETDSYQKNSAQMHKPWPHWYQNEPYHLKRQRPEVSRGGSVSNQNQWNYPPPPNMPPHPRFHRPPFPHQHHQSGFPNPTNLPAHVRSSLNCSAITNHYQDDYNFPSFSNFPPPNISHPSQGFYGNSPQQFGRDDRGCYFDTHSDHPTVGWSKDRKEKWSRCDEDYDRRQRFDSRNEPWEQQNPFQPCDDRHTYNSALVLILMRGLPGSGKTTLARELLSTGPSGLILSTDDYFAHKGGYCYDPGLLGAAHEWNQSRAKDALHDGRSPVIIDNTNLQAWEMKPYVKMALEMGYKVDFCEPDTGWKFDPLELEKRNKHGVPQEKITQMMDRFSFPISIDIVLSSQEPSHVNQRRRPENSQII